MRLVMHWALEKSGGSLMLRKVAAYLFIACLSIPGLPAAAADAPDILVGPSNAVPQCVTPGRLMAFLKQRNPELNPRYDGIATEYMRQGEMLGLRWDFAFYQMVIETGALSYWRGNRAGDVKAEQNNFAGLGATGKGERGESFKDLASGVRAHLEHLLLYAGRPVDNPVAERTRKVREWGVLASWQQSFKRPISYADLAAKWAPGTRSYFGMLETVAERYQTDLCSRPDPRPQLVQEARAHLAKSAGPAKAAETLPPWSGLGAQPAPETAPSFPPFKVLNPPPAETASVVKAAPPADAKPVAAPAVTPKAGTGDKSGPRAVMAGLAPTKAKGLAETAAPPAANQKCRVWTASYGGQKAVIIRSLVDQVVNFTVLDVNDGTENREVEAFISAYAKNGRVAGEYGSQAQALDKAFELCPEG